MGRFFYVVSWPQKLAWPLKGAEVHFCSTAENTSSRQSDMDVSGNRETPQNGW